MHPAFAFILFATCTGGAILPVPVGNQLLETIFSDNHHGEILNDDVIENIISNRRFNKEEEIESNFIPLDSTLVEKYYPGGISEYIPAIHDTDYVLIDEDISVAANDFLPVYSVPIEIPFESEDSLEYLEPLETNEDGVNYHNMRGNCSHSMEAFQNSTGTIAGTKLVGCMCAIFTTINPSEEDAPLTSRLFHNITCHQNVASEETCHTFCISIAYLYNDLQDDIVCASVPGHASNLKAFLQAKLCEEDTEWEYTGVSSSAPVCCYMGSTVPC